MKAQAIGDWYDGGYGVMDLLLDVRHGDRKL
jgi:hypothetical protein